MKHEKLVRDFRLHVTGKRENGDSGWVWMNDCGGGKFAGEAVMLVGMASSRDSSRVFLKKFMMS